MNRYCELAASRWFLVSSRFGFGLMDAGLMTWYATGWKNVPPMSTCESVTANPKRTVPPRSHEIFNLDLNECKNTVDPAREVNYIEQVQVFVTLATDRRGEIEIYLYSPSNTRTQLLPVSFICIANVLFIESFRDENVIKAIKAFKIGHSSPFSSGVKFHTARGNCKSSTMAQEQVSRRIPRAFVVALLIGNVHQNSDSSSSSNVTFVAISRSRHT